MSLYAAAMLPPPTPPACTGRSAASNGKSFHGDPATRTGHGP